MALLTALEFQGTREATISGLSVCKTAGGNSYTHQNGKVEGEAVDNLDRRLEWKTIHVGTNTTEHIRGVA